MRALLVLCILLLGAAAPWLAASAATGDDATIRVRLSPTGYQRGEPTVGVASDGTIFTVGNVRDPNDLTVHGMLLRSRDHGLSWTLLTDPVRESRLDFDPWVWLDPRTDRVFNGPLYVACDWLTWSDDGGGSWDVNPLGGCGLPFHDQEKITTGPPPAGVPTLGYPDVVYYSYDSLRDEGTWVSESFDGGRTFNPGALAHPFDNCQFGSASPVAVAPNGIAFSAKATCKGVDVSATTDAGASWTQVAHVAQEGIPSHLLTLGIAVDTAGNPYVSFQGADEALYLAASPDGGHTWNAPARVSPPGLHTVFSAVAAGTPGRVAIAYLGTNATWPGGDPSFAPDNATWNLHLAYVLDALSANPEPRSVQVTGDADPVQRGCVWLQGEGGTCRQLRDFIGATQRDGRVYVSYADACRACVSTADRLDPGETVVAIVEEGPSLLGGTLTPTIPG